MIEEKLPAQGARPGKAPGSRPAKAREKKADAHLSEGSLDAEALSANPNVQLYLDRPERRGYLKESLKNYLLIDKNIYLNRQRKVPSEDDSYLCECLPSAGLARKQLADPSLSLDCGPRCLNSIISIECDAATCPCGELCQNRKFQRHQNASVFPVQFGEKGFGLVAAKPIPKDTFIIQYIGEVLSINSEEGKRRLQLYAKSTCTYMMRLSSKEVIDPTFKGNMARFINHSCDPNCETRKWNVRGEIEVGIVAIKDIREGEELTFDYKFDVYLTPLTACLCGSQKCKSYLGLVPVDYTQEEWDLKMDNLPCEVCGGTDEVGNNQLILCDICNNGYHLQCWDPRMTEIPKGAWFCSKCKSRNQDEVALDRSVDDKPEQLAPVPSNDRPLKQMLREDKKLRNFYLKRKAEKLLSEEKARDPDPEESFLREYREFYLFQRRLQLENIYEFLEELKQEKRELEREKQRLKIVEEKANPRRPGDPEKPEEPIAEEEPEEDESEPPAEPLPPNPNPKSQTQIPTQPELTSVNDKIKAEMAEQFMQNFMKSETFEKIRQRSIDQEGYKHEETSRNIMLVSSIELFLFLQTKSQNKFITQNGNVTLFWNNSQPQHPDLFEKTIEFTITGTKSHLAIFKELFKFMDDEIEWYKKVSGFTKAKIYVPAIFLKRVLGEFQRNIHYIEKVYQVRVQYDKNFLTDECYAMHETTVLTLKGIKDNISKARDFLQEIVNKLSVHRIYMCTSEIRVIISNLIMIKQQIHPSEIRCCRDNALRDINHPFYTIYYKDKEVAFVGTEKEIEVSMAIVQNEITRAKAIVKNNFSLNYLLPCCDKNAIKEIKNDIENENRETKLIIYEPLHPRKNISLTLISTYEHFDKAYLQLQKSIDDANLFQEKFENYQIQTLYQMSKYFFKYLQNYFQTRSIIFMKAWDSISSEFSHNCNRYRSSFVLTKSLYIRDHELKFYILSVNQMGYDGSYQQIGLTKADIVLVLKSIVNKTLLFDENLQQSFSSYQSIFSFDSDFIAFLKKYNPKAYLSEYSYQKVAEFEASLRRKLLSDKEIERDGEIKFPKKEVIRNDNYRMQREARIKASFLDKESEEEESVKREVSVKSKVSHPKKPPRGPLRKKQSTTIIVKDSNKRKKKKPSPSPSSSSSEDSSSSEASKRRKSKKRKEKKKAKKSSKSRHKQQKRQRSSSSSRDSSSDSRSDSSSSDSSKHKKQKKKSPKKKRDSSSKASDENIEIIYQTTHRAKEPKRKRSRSKSPKKKSRKSEHKRKAKARESSSSSSSEPKKKSKRHAQKKRKDPRKRSESKFKTGFRRKDHSHDDA